MDKRKILEQYYNNENNEEQKNTQSDIERKEMLEQYYDKNKDLKNDLTENIGMKYIGLVFLDVILLNIMTALGFGIFDSRYGYNSNFLLVIILWIIDVFVLALFLYSARQTIKYLKKL